MSSDPQDLLYTNQFISTDILDESTIQENTKFYNRYLNHLDESNNVPTNEYLETNLTELNKVNINNSLYSQWPITNNKNPKPLTNTFIKDVSEDNYQFTKNKKVIIDSSNRNKNKFPYSTNFEISINYSISNIEKIEFTDFDVPNLVPNVGIYNNNFCWQYFSNYFAYNNIAFNFIPVPAGSNLISYYDLPYSCSRIPTKVLLENPTFNPEVFLTYQINIPPADYSTTTLSFAINQISTLVNHGGKDYNVFPDDKQKLKADGLDASNFYEEPYLSFNNLKNSSHKWKFAVEKNQNTFYAVNRMEEVNISAMQTFDQPLNKSYNIRDFELMDVFHKFSNKKLPLDTKLFYIIIPFKRFVTDMWFNNSGSDAYPNNDYENPFIPNAFPLVITDTLNIENIQDSKIGGMSKYYLSYTTFFDIRIYEMNGIKDVDTVNYYKYFDTLDIPTLDGSRTQQYFRFGLSYNPELARGKSFNNAIPSTFKDHNPIPSNSETLIFDIGLFETLKSSSLELKSDFTIQPLIGRALLNRFMFDKINGEYTPYVANDSYLKKTSVLSHLGLPIGNQTAGLFVSNYNYGFSFIQTTKNFLILNGNNPYSLSTIIPETYQVAPPLGIQRTSNDLIVSNPFFYFKLNFPDLDENSIIQDSSIIAEDKYNLTINQNYIKNPKFSSASLGFSAECLESYSREVIPKSSDFILFKLDMTSSESGTGVTYSSVNKMFTCYDKPIDQLSRITVQILDSEFREIESGSDISFVMNLITNDRKLKNTEINTQTNSIASASLTNKFV